MAFKFNEYHLGGGGGSSGGSAVLGELTVTENGVYDEPMISNTPEPITWDGVIGDKATVNVGNGMTFVKVSDKALSAEDLVGATVVLLNTATVVLTNEMISSASGGVVLPELAAVSVSDVEAFSASMGVSFPENGTYFVYSANTGIYTESITFPPAPPIPADGWNKVTVNVAGDIVDVPELPTENIEEGKIYRVTTAGEPVTEIWHSIPPSVIEGMGGGLKPLTRNDEFIKTLMGENATYELRVVDTLPEVGESCVMGQSFYIYVVNDPSSEAFMFIDGAGWIPCSAADFGEYMGTVNDMGDIKEPTDDSQLGYYILKRAGESSTTYGIPNAHPVKRLVDGAWVELA